MIWQPWTSKPTLGSQINWANPITAGSVLGLPFLERNGASSFDLVGGLQFTAESGASFGSNQDGVAAGIPASSSAYWTSPSCSDAGLLGDSTFLWRGCITAYDGLQGLLDKNASNGGSDSPINAYVTNSSPNVLSLVRANNSGYNGWSINSQPVITASDIHTFILSCPQNIGAAPTFYIDGVQYATSSYTGGSTGSVSGSGSPWRIGRRPDGATQLNGYVSLVWAWSRQLSPTEAVSLSGNVWQLFTPQWSFWAGSEAPAFYAALLPAM